MSNIIQTFPKGSGGGHVVLDTNGTAVDQEKKLQFTGLDVSDDSTNEKTEVKAVGLNADSLNDIIQSASVQGNAVAGNGLVYSTTEQIVGKWIDGKPIYQKTFKYDVPADTSDVNFTQVNIGVATDNAKAVLNSEVYIDYGSGNTSTPHYRHYVNSKDRTDEAFVFCNNDKIIKLSYRIQSQLAVSIYATIRYTKTTDT